MNKVIKFSEELFGSLYVTILTLCSVVYWMAFYPVVCFANKKNENLN